MKMKNRQRGNSDFAATGSAVRRLSRELAEGGATSRLAFFATPLDMAMRESGLMRPRDSASIAAESALRRAFHGVAFLSTGAPERLARSQSLPFGRWSDRPFDLPGELPAFAGRCLVWGSNPQQPDS